jgi:hypothetical protein
VHGLLDEVGCLNHLAFPHVVNDRLCLVVGCLTGLSSRTLIDATWLKT